MTDPERPADAPASPTPEEISARLEALLKRTHALRARKAAEPSQPLTITWPPPDRELDHYDVVDVPEDDRMQSTAPPAAAAAPTPVPDETTTRDRSDASAARQESFARPDWSELRLRSAPEEPSGPSRAWLALTILLALATVAQAAYIWSMQRATPVGEGRLRVDGPDGAIVRVNGQPIGPAPIDHELAPGDYDIDVAVGSTTARAERVSIGLGRTVVLLPAGEAQDVSAPPASAGTPTAPAVTAPPSDRPSTAPAAASPNPAATASGAVSATLGGVLIESAPSGLPVTMEGRPRGVTPITIGQLKPGRHDVLVGGLPRRVEVTAGRVTTLRVSRP